jgi:hypothetical protein
MTKKKESKKERSMPKEGGSCRWCDGKYREAKKTGGSSVTPSVFRFGVDNIGKTFSARVYICDVCGHIEFFNVQRGVEDANA